ATTASARPPPLPVVNVPQAHGAAPGRAPAATAFALREEHYSVVNIGMWVDGGGEAETTWTWRAKARMAPHASPGLYVNFLGEDGEGAIREAYRANYDRLVRIKAEYDPENIFRSNQNIRPS
ncbi:MAG TPA: BBE domain-containing protein, partial [Chloroflexaceae bacterium]|nr:BBE domain-containing protein [Chloroflexaceae bacterium]